MFSISALLYLKATHIIFVITWFAGLFYAARLLVYQREAYDKDEPERSILLKQLNVMLNRLLYIITWPSAMITLVVGILLLTYYQQFPIWLNIKLVFLVALYLYMFSLDYLYKRHKRNDFRLTSTQLRLYNEIPTVILVGIVFLVVVKTTISLLYGLIGLLVLVVALISGVKIYKYYRQKGR